MTNREKVIKGLECCLRYAQTEYLTLKECEGCPYSEVITMGTTCSTLAPLLTDALELLREQEREEDDGK